MTKLGMVTHIGRGLLLGVRPRLPSQGSVHGHNTPNTLSGPRYRLLTRTRFDLEQPNSGFATPSVRTKISQRSIKYQGPFAWNKLPTAIKISYYSVPTFKNKLNSTC